MINYPCWVTDIGHLTTGSVVSNQEAFASSNPRGRDTGRLGLLEYQSGHKQGKLHSKPHYVKVTRYSLGSWQWMVTCTQRSDLCYPVENFLNRTIREKNWVSRWSAPTGGGISMLSFYFLELFKSKVHGQDGYWSIINNRHSMEHLSLSLVCKL